MNDSKDYGHQEIRGDLLEHFDWLLNHNPESVSPVYKQDITGLTRYIENKIDGAVSDKLEEVEREIHETSFKVSDGLATNIQKVKQIIKKHK